MSGDGITQVWLVTVKIPCMGTFGALAKKAVLASDVDGALATALGWASSLPEFPHQYRAAHGHHHANEAAGVGTLTVPRPSSRAGDDYANDVVIRVERVEVVG